MKLRVMRAAGAMLEAGDYEIAGGLAVHRSAVADAGGSHMPLNMGHRGPDGLAMRRDQSPVARDLGHDRHRLGRAQGHVPAGAVFHLSVPNGATLLACNLAVQQIAKLTAESGRAACGKRSGASVEI